MDAIRCSPFKELLMVRLEIDLNFLEMDEAWIETFGFKMDEPLVVCLNMN